MRNRTNAYDLDATATRLKGRERRGLPPIGTTAYDLSSRGRTCASLIAPRGPARSAEPDTDEDKSSPDRK